MEKGEHYGVPLERSDYLELPPHKHSCRPDGFQSWLKGFGRGKRLAVDLFSGAGGLSFGLEEAGWTVAAAVDFDERARQTHEANFPGMSLRMDLGSPEERDRLVGMFEGVSVDLVAGGPPCQPFSRAGRSKIRDLVRQNRRDPHDRRKELWIAYLDVVKRLRPRAVLMENVPDMGLGDDFFVIRTIEDELEELGYATQVRLVDAWAYGVPQHRKRLILLARRDVDEFHWGAAQERTTLKEAIGDLPALDVIARERVGSRNERYEERTERSGFADKMREGAPHGLVWDHMTRRVRDDDYKIFTIMDSKTLYSEIGDKLSEEEKNFQRYSVDHFTDKYKKLDWNELSRTITAHIAKDGYWYIHPSEPRTLTVREAARVQTFPDRFRFAGTRSDAFRQIGNAVPPMLGRAAAEVLQPVEGREMPAEGLHPYWKEVRRSLTEWAVERRSSTEDWYQLPAEQPRLLHAAVMAVLSATKMKSSAIAQMMGVVKDARVLTPALFGKLVAVAPSKAVEKRLKDRLEPLVGASRSLWSDEDHIIDKMPMKPGELAMFRLLAGQDLMLLGQSSLRVAARLNQTDSHRTNRLSNGRVDMVKLVGAGEEAPLRMAAIRLIGMTRCFDKGPYCSACPLLQYCPGTEDNAALDGAV
ncbi:DNA cytosine methyltransferase [Streptomyces roseolus]|uniref:DNA cytosine methyltransferase n=1 Tax=Streptomyces roseolus TaxID=67358 RepID=UPI0037B9EE01